MARRLSGGVLAALSALAALGSCAQGEDITQSPGGFGGSGGVAGADASLSDATGGSSGSSGVSGNAGSSGAAGTGAGGSGGGVGGSAGSTGGAAGSTGGAAGSTGGTGGSTGGAGGTGGTGGSTGGSGGAAGCNVVSYDFASCPGGWSTAGKNVGWQCGKPTTGPGADHTGGGNTWGTALSGGAPFCSDSFVTSPTIDLSSYQGLALKLRFWQWHDFRACNTAGPLCGFVCALDTSTYSGGLVEVYDGGAWVKVSPTGGYTGAKIDCYSVDQDGGTTCEPCTLDGVQGFAGTSGGWVPVEIDISSFAHATFQLRFHFASYENEFLCHPNKAGWFIDDVAIAKLSCP